MTALDETGGFGAGGTLPPLPEDWERCLAVAAHPDDIEHGTASAVARWTTQGKRVPFLTWAARQGGPALGVEAAVLFDVHQLAFEGPPPWDQGRPAD